VSGFEQYLPAISGPAVPDAVVWNSVSPRASFSYAVDESRKTLLRGSYALFASQLLNGESNIIGVASQYRYIAFDAVDTNGNGVADYNEIDLNAIETWWGFDINDPSKLTTINQIGDYKVPKTHEIILGVDRELVPNFGVSAAFTWRKLVDFNWRPRIGVTRAAYVQTGTFTASGLPDGSSVGVPYYALDETKVTDIDAAQGLVLTAQNGYHQRYWGIEVAATKRMSNHWMARFGFSTNTHQEFFDDPDTAITDPTPTPASPLIDGGLVLTQSTSSGKSGIWLVLPKYQFVANGVYQAPKGIDLGANLVMRQGYGQPWNQSRVATGDYFSNRKTLALFTDINENRLPTVATFDVRFGWNPLKAFNVKGRVGLNIDLDIFNLFNSGTVLQRQYDKRLTGATGFNQTLEIMNPRIFRLGARFTF
jgi:hypothetical protein